jgi:hypothetical protein
VHIAYKNVVPTDGKNEEDGRLTGVQSVYFHKAEGCQGKKIFKYNFAH